MKQKLSKATCIKWDLPLAYPPVLPPFSVSEDGVVSANRSFDYEELSNTHPGKSD